jgi:hypothetical protein
MIGAVWGFFAVIPPWMVGHWPLTLAIVLAVAALSTLAVIKERT